MPQIHQGNAQQDGADRNGWLVGSFMPDGIRLQDNVEIKYGVHSADESRNTWATDETRTTMCLLINGEFTLQFKDKTITLSKTGDYVMWDAGTDHTWTANQDSEVLTIRWTSETGENI